MVDETGGSKIGSAEALSLEQGRAALALGAAGMGEFEWDFVRDRFVVSPRMSAITGLPQGETSARGGLFALGFVHPDDLEAVRSSVGERLVRDGGYELRYRMIRPDNGQVQWMESAAVILRAVGGPVEKVIGVVRDISKRKAEEDEREALVAELDHRVKNVLAAVQSLAAQSARQTVSLDAFLATFGGRLDAMAAAHTLLTATRWRGAAIGDIAAAELGGLACGRARCRPGAGRACRRRCPCRARRQFARVASRALCRRALAPRLRTRRRAPQRDLVTAQSYREKIAAARSEGGRFAGLDRKFARTAVKKFICIAHSNSSSLVARKPPRRRRTPRTSRTRPSGRSRTTSRK